MKKWEVIINGTFYKSFAKTDPSSRKQIVAFLETCQEGIEEPFQLQNLKKLRNHDGYYRLRFGKYRVGIFIDKQEKTFNLCLIQKRGDFYKHFPPRR